MILLHAIELSLIINGIYIVFTWEKMILQPFGDLLETRLPESVCKMFFACATCMSGIYGLVTYIVVIDKPDFLELLAFILMTACISTVINIFLECGKAFLELMDYELKEKSGANDLGRASKF